MKFQPYKLELRLSPSQVDAIKKSVTQFLKHEKNWADRPEVNGQTLSVSAPALPFLFAYLNPQDSNQLDLYRLKKTAVELVGRLLGEAREFAAVHCYRTTLDNLRDFVPGVFLRPETNDADT